jgi:hypothetical protein
VNELLLLTLLSLLTIGLMIASMAGARSQLPRELRREAEEKGLVLLSSWFTPEQAAQLMSRREFEVVGSDTGTRYRITTKPGGMNVHELDGTGRTVMRWCFGPAGLAVSGDILLAQKIALETMEEQARAIANRQRAV